MMDKEEQLLVDVKAHGEGPNEGKKESQKNYTGTTGGWDASFSVAHVLIKNGVPINGTRAIFRMNHENGGFDCPGCAWPDDRKGLRMDICENGIKHSTSEMTHKRCCPEFFAKHTVAELRTWSGYQLEQVGRLTQPMVYDPNTDHYVPISWEAAFKMIGDKLQSLQSPHEAAFYTSGRLSNEGTFVYQLLSRELGTNNQPDCSNMCHEASGRALTASLATGKGTVDLIDWQKADVIFLMGINAASNTPRMLTALTDDVKDHQTRIVHVNPLIEGAARPAITPHEIMDMALFRATKASTLNVQPRIGGDMALLRGMAKALLEDAQSQEHALDRDFIHNYTHGFEDYQAICVAENWEHLTHQSGVPEKIMREMAQIYKTSRATIFGWCLGLTQHEHGVDTVREIVNVLLLRGNIGREGAGPSPVRGHSNVQGNRTCGINNRPTEEFLKKLDEACGITSPREHGYGTVATIEAMMRGEVKVFIGLGGNFVKSVPDPAYTEKAMQNCELSVQITTKLNRSHVVHGKAALILPCLGRTEIDMQESGPQFVTVEDSMAMVHPSTGMKSPASSTLLSEVAIVAGIAKASLPHTKTPWDDYVKNYDNIRETMSHALDGFEEFNRRVRQPLGFRLKQPARELVFHTPSGKAEFSCAPLPDVVPKSGFLKLMTMRSHDQFNTTIYADNDRYRGVKNTRTILLMNKQDMDARGIEHMALIDITSIAKDGSRRRVRGYHAVAYDIPMGCTGGYMPELNVICPIGDYSTQSDQPIFKELTVEVTRHVDLK
jgi:molybdopterin-dependent oxidoreductase alpha subunit